MNCIFCKIVSKDIPSKIVYENDKVLAFYDISPAAREHILIIPKKHIPSIDHISADDRDISAALFDAAREIAKLKNMQDEGYRIIINNGKAAGQEVFHLHLHLLGGEKSLGPMLSL
ncbi:MAG: histidine triad nucleotide-binding protein [Leptospirales bacterium]|nr:histidine triad nucleotide-binding protein [Leptospirales bacterium]